MAKTVRASRGAGGVIVVQAPATKRRTNYARRPAKRHVRHHHTRHLGVLLGIAGTLGAAALTESEGAYGGGAPAVQWLMDRSQPISKRLRYAGSSFLNNLNPLTHPENYTPVIVGAAVTASPRIPIVGMISRPVNTELKNNTRQKWGL